MNDLLNICVYFKTVFWKKSKKVFFPKVFSTFHFWTFLKNVKKKFQKYFLIFIKYMIPYNDNKQNIYEIPYALAKLC